MLALVKWDLATINPVGSKQRLSITWIKNEKVKFFDYSSPHLYNTNMDLGLMNNSVKLIVKGKFKFNRKKLVKTVLWVILAIVIKSICQYVLGAEVTSIENIVLGLDGPFYLGCIIGGWIMVLLQDNWDNLMSEYFPNSITMKFDSGDENTDDEVTKKSWKGKGKEKITDSDTTTSTISPTATAAVTQDLENLNLNTMEERVKEYISRYKIRELKHPSLSNLSDEEIFKLLDKAKEITQNTHSYIENISNKRDLLKEGNFYLKNSLIGGNSDKKLTFDINDKKAAANLINLVTQYSQINRSYMYDRLEWITDRIRLLETQDAAKVVEHILRMLDSQNTLSSMLGPMTNIRALSDGKGVKVWYCEYNKHRNSFIKELTLAEGITTKGLKKSPLCTLNHPNSKSLIKALNAYSNAKDQYNTEENYLKKKLGEAVNNIKITTSTKTK